MCTKFGVDGSSCFPFRARTNRQTDTHDLTYKTYKNVYAYKDVSSHSVQATFNV